ncbi:aminotransferase class V-fold PLP-dependent enzyme [Cellulosilyticum sp. I15G10I2]|uniref:aminotransferase class V-fold PLP-dependent enzyme n=1 Tax=Cellulosilyticum sp. I15G10I2 TaxID=1892843 RepID=UPI000B0F6A3C
MDGGVQERGKRAGTENVSAIVGLGKEIELAIGGMEERNKRIILLRDTTINQILNRIPYVKLNGNRHKRLPGNANFSFVFVEGESLLLILDMNGGVASSGSACTSGSLNPSHVLFSIGFRTWVSTWIVKIGV